MFGAIVGNGRTTDHDLLLGYLGHDSGLHLQGTFHIDAPDASRRWQVDRAGHQRDFGAELGSRRGEGKAHLAGAVVADVTHRIQRLAGWSCGDQDAQIQLRFGQEADAFGNQFIRVQHAARTHIATGLGAGGWPPQLHTPLCQGLQVRLGGGVQIHLLIHRRGQCHGGRSGQAQGGQQLVGHAGGQAGDHIGGCWCNQHQIGPFGQLDMVHPLLAGGVENAFGYGMTRNGLQRQRRDEGAGGIGQHDPDFSALFP